jgi:hypothetical protein
MPQTILPIFPPGVTLITAALAFENRDNKITYFHGSLPVFSHAKDDIPSFRMITSQFYVNGHTRNDRQTVLRFRVRRARRPTMSVPGMGNS